MLFIHRLRSIFTIQISTRCTLSIKSTWRTSQHGHNDRGLPLVDVARIIFSSSIFIHRIFLSIVQRLHTLQSHVASRSHMARLRAEFHVLHSLSWQRHHDNSCDTTKMAGSFDKSVAKCLCI